MPSLNAKECKGKPFLLLLEPCLASNFRSLSISLSFTLSLSLSWAFIRPEVQKKIAN
jgi:hypothetical protein